MGSFAARFHVVPKLLHLLVYGGLGCIQPFLSIFFASRGIPSGEIGILTSIAPFIGFVVTPSWSLLADKTQSHRLVLMITICATGIFGGLMGFITSIRSIFAFLPLVILYSISASPLGALVDHSVLSLLGTEKNFYGRQRVFGAIGWGITAFVSGLLSDTFGDLRVLFLGLVVVFVLFFLVVLFGVPRSLSDSESPGSVVPPQVSSALPLLLRRLSFFLVMALFVGMGMSIISNFLFLFLVEHLDAPDTLLGLSISVTVLMELPFFFWSEVLLRIFKVRGLIIISHISFILRALAYTLLTSAWWVLPIELLHGVTFACMWTAVVAHASNVAPKGLEATSQGILNATFGGLGMGLGAILGGFVYQEWGPIVLFRGLAVGLFVSLILFLVTYRASDYTMLEEIPLEKRGSSSTEEGEEGQGEREDEAPIELDKEEEILLGQSLVHEHSKDN